jgi:hypothetical protein
MFDTVVLQFTRCSLAEDKVSLDPRVDNLAGNVLVGEADDKAVFGGVTINERDQRKFSIFQ